MKYTMTIAHRVCPVLAKTAVGFNDKLEMVTASAESLAAALETIRTHLIVILDGCDNRYEETFRYLFSGKDNIYLEFINTPAIGNYETWEKQVELLSSVTDSEFVYFSEDDYIYSENAFKAMLDFLRENNADFVTPLDHPDRYLNVLPEPHAAEFLLSSYSHWRSSGTTCLTFMTRPSVVNACLSEFSVYTHGGGDIVMWLGLTKEKIFSTTVLAKAFWLFLFRHGHPFCQVAPLATWKWHGLKLLFSKRRKLYAPIPTLAVHLCNVSLPSDCETILNKCKLNDEKIRMIVSEADKYLRF